MLRFLAGAAACFLLMSGAFLIWQSHAAQAPGLPDAPAARASNPSIFGVDQPLKAPEASPKSREEKRFSRYDHDKDGKVEAAEYLASRRKNFDKLDGDHNGALSGICREGHREVQRRWRQEGLAVASRIRDDRAA